jgi:arylsulfatase A-like enzyme
MRDVIPANRSKAEQVGAHPAVAAFMTHEESQNFAREKVRKTVIPAYMGLISQIDHHIGRVIAHLESRGLAHNTIIVFTSDHGDYLGDHWLGEKELFHEEIVRVPLIVYDPRDNAAATRGWKPDLLVEAIDLAPTFLQWAGGREEPHRLEGCSLVDVVDGAAPSNWREAVYCDSDFVFRYARKILGLSAQQSRAYMVRTARWKYVFFEQLPPQLFDLKSDPRELNDLGRAIRYRKVRADMERKLFDWFRARKTRVTVPAAYIERVVLRNTGHIFGVW